MKALGVCFMRIKEGSYYLTLLDRHNPALRQRAVHLERTAAVDAKLRLVGNHAALRLVLLVVAAVRATDGQEGHRLFLVLRIKKVLYA